MLERRAKGLERLERDDPWRDGGCKTLGQERSQRLVFPCLHVACGPVVEQYQAEDVVLGALHRNGLAKRVGGADEDAQLELVIESACRPEAGRRIIRRLELTQRPLKRLRAHADGGRAAVVPDGY